MKLKIIIITIQQLKTSSPYLFDLGMEMYKDKYILLERKKQDKKLHIDMNLIYMWAGSVIISSDLSDNKAKLYPSYLHGNCSKVDV